MQSGKRLTQLKDYFAKHTRTHKNHKNTNVELLLSTQRRSDKQAAKHHGFERLIPGVASMTL